MGDVKKVMVTFKSEATGKSEHVALVSVRADTHAAPLVRLTVLRTRDRTLNGRRQACGAGSMPSSQRSAALRLVSRTKSR